MCVTLVCVALGQQLRAIPVISLSYPRVFVGTESLNADPFWGLPTLSSALAHSSLTPVMLPSSVALNSQGPGQTGLPPRNLEAFQTYSAASGMGDP